MNWLGKMRRAWLAVFSRFRHPKSTARSSISGSRSEGNIGLVKLQGDVEMCGYENVRTMWDILSKTTEMIGSHTRSSGCVKHDHHHSKQQRMNKKMLFERATEGANDFSSVPVVASSI